jgi:pimeloyl-ACP methyl ester carboxylesterase
MRRFFTRKRVLVSLVILVLLVLIVLYAGLPLGSALVAVAPQPASGGDAPAGFETVTLTTDDGINLAGWYAGPQNGAVILLLHGAGDGRGSLRDYAVMLREAGYGVLALNLRGFGDSEGQINRLGWRAPDDIGAAVQFLGAQDGVSTMGGLGLSMGGEALLGAASTYPELQAIVADGATYRPAADYESLPTNSVWCRSFSQHIFNAFVRLLSGNTLPERTLLDSVSESGDTQFLFIAAETLEDEVAYNTLFHEAAPDRSLLWVIPDIGHTGGFASAPASYRGQVLGFFDAVLGG